ncbi:Lrp/AsnC family transcriptional regulator [Methylobacterium oryzae]|uniref:Lrp/AsnC family transcriptional regulator n=1 Tax=Methylobacterium oryzae TaxID=334852 RepID=UPI001F216956|nr:winged helix-turn-helix transcriptional regulator [Methylobacterium oryzae]UIN36841.1 winged helix-turn-helix transcriptional regulator [Methylobacterium oryzae]
MLSTPKLDRIDVNILARLQQNGRMTNITLASEVGLSPSPCLARVKRLEKAGYISGYGAHLNLAKLGEAQLVFTSVTLGDHRREDFVRFEQSIRSVNELVECHLVSGGFDYLLKFMTRGIPHYQQVIDNLLDRKIGIAKYFTYIVIKSPIAKNHVPLEAILFDD